MTTSNWNLDTVHSGINFTVRHMVVSKVRGRFAKFTGTVALDESDFTRSSVEATIDASSIDTGTAQRDDHLKSADFFDVAHFPQIRFRSTQIEKLGGERYRLTGDLTIRDVTRPIALDVEYGGRGKDPWGNTRIGASAATKIKRSDFGVKTYLPAVGDEVQLSIAGAFEQQA